MMRMGRNDLVERLQATSAEEDSDTDCFDAMEGIQADVTDKLEVPSKSQKNEVKNPNGSVDHSLRHCRELGKGIQHLSQDEDDYECRLPGQLPEHEKALEKPLTELPSMIEEVMEKLESNGEGAQTEAFGGGRAQAGQTRAIAEGLSAEEGSRLAKAKEECSSVLKKVMEKTVSQLCTAKTRKISQSLDNGASQKDVLPSKHDWALETDGIGANEASLMRERNAKTAGNPTTKDMDAKAAGLPKKRDRNGTLLPRVIRGSEGLEAQMWREPGGHVKVVIRVRDEEAEPQQLTWKDALDGLSSDSPAFRELLSETLQELPFDAFFWECPPVSLATLGTRLFEFVALDAPRLARVQADQVSFKEHLNRYRGQRVSKAFLNLGGDAMLVAPAAAVKDVQAYAHIASFFRQAPPEQLDQQWLTLGSALERRLREVGPRRNVWVSTDGTGVYWLHMRLDARPKYYHYRAYQN